MADQLTFAIAMREAQSLTTIDGFKNYEAAIIACAEDLIRWCKGAIVEGRVWPAEAQAHWLVTEARQQWDRWRGTSALYTLFRSKFDSEPLRPELKTWQSGDKPPIGCHVCNDNGIVRGVEKRDYCTCDQGQRMAVEMGQSWLDILNRQQKPDRRMRNGVDISFEAQQRAFEAHQQRIREELAAAQAMLADAEASPEQKQLAAEFVRVYEAKEKRRNARKGATS